MSKIQLFKICFIACLVSLATSTISINTLVPSRAFKLSGFNNANNFGIPAAVASAGDINKDGYEDFIVGSSFENTTAGAVYVLYGNSTANLQSIFGTSPYLQVGVNIDPSIGFRINGPKGFGNWVASAGDIDNDGYDDILIGSPSESTNTGAAYLLYGASTSTLKSRYGKPTPFTVSSSMTSSIGFKLVGRAEQDIFGSFLSCAGDINKDGYADIIIGAPYELSKRGAAYVFYGASKSVLRSRLGASFTVGTAMTLTTGFRLQGWTGSMEFGISVSSAGDFNGDGYDDLLIGARQQFVGRGGVFIIYGAPQSTLATRLGASFDVTDGDMALTTGFRMIGNLVGFNNLNTGLGGIVASAGDFNGDGYADIIVGASAEDHTKGAAYVLYGGSPSTLSTRYGKSFTVASAMPSTTGFRIIGPSTATYFGNSVSSAGDFNNDNYTDIMIGSPRENTNTGAVYVLYGAPQATLATRFGATYTVSDTILPSVGAKITGPSTNSSFGFAPIAAGDINGDGIKDLIIGAKVSGTAAVAYVVYNYSCLYIRSNGNCIYRCPLQTFSNNGMCTDCTTGCNVCTSTGSTACVACRTGNLHYGSCITDCPIGFFAKNRACLPCPNGCSSCVAAKKYTAAKCTACNAGFALHNGDCVAECPCGFIKENSVCEACTSGCCSCTSKKSNECTQCTVNPLLDGSCVTACPNDFFNDQGVCNSCNGNCPCPAECSSCSGSECTVCHPGFFLHKGTCVESCPCGFFEDNSLCSACTPGCCSCTSGDSNACTQCSIEYFFEGSCVFPCPENYYSNHGVCAPCYPGCSTCSTAASNACTSCSVGVLLGRSCVPSCPDNYRNANGVCTS